MTRYFVTPTFLGMLQPMRRILTVLGLVGCVTAGASRPPQAYLELRGRVTDVHGVPIERALIRVETAKPREGPSLVCPSCYRECGRSAETDATGAFRIPSLSRNLLYDLLIVAQHHRPGLTKHVAPEAFQEIRLTPRAPDELSGRNVIRGQLLTRDGKGLAYGVIEPLGYRDGHLAAAGLPPGIDALVVADDQGRFALRAFPGAVLVAKAQGRGWAPQILEFVNDETSRSWILTEGGSLRGTVRFRDRPAAGAVIGLVPTVRDALGLSDSSEIATDKRGAFSISNVPPERD
jgi:hypothetical protein